MHALSPALCALALLSVSGPALALDSWTATTERGLPVLSLAQGEGSVRIVCDPDRVFGPTPNGAVLVSLPKDKAPTTVVFLAETGEQARLPVANGSAAQHIYAFGAFIDMAKAHDVWVVVVYIHIWQDGNRKRWDAHRVK